MDLNGKDERERQRRKMRKETDEMECGKEAGPGKEKNSH